MPIWPSEAIFVSALSLQAFWSNIFTLPSRFASLFFLLSRPSSCYTFSIFTTLGKWSFAAIAHRCCRQLAIEIDKKPRIPFDCWMKSSSRHGLYFLSSILSLSLSMLFTLNCDGINNLIQHVFFKQSPPFTETATQNTRNIW